MVIQRSWKILSDTGSTSASSTEANRSPTGLNSSSDDSNCSNQTTHSMVTSVASPPGNLAVKTELPTTIPTANTTDMIKFVTTPQYAENTLQKLRQRYGCYHTNTTSTNESAMRSLELVRIAVQNSFDQDINDLVKKFIENYFKPAFKNIKENLGQGAINEDVFQKMSCALLENAKSQYKVYRTKQQNPLLSQESTVRMAVKRPATNMKSAITTVELQKRFFPDNLIIQPQPQQQLQSLEHIIKPAAPLTAASTSTLANYANSANITNEQKILPTTVQTARRQIYWNTAHISTTTKFVLDVQANQAFGFGSDGKERLASKHPELIRYLPDNEDRDWLVAQQIIPQQNRSSRFLFLIYDEINRLYQTHEIYRNKPNIDLSLMMTFTVADFIIQKMKIFFVDLNIKSRGLITNSYSITGTSNTMQSNSHLRNALLQGTPTTQATATAPQPPTDSCASVLNGNNSTNNTTADSTNPQKSKSSTLSSSHATLTALLNNSTNNIDKTAPLSGQLNKNNKTN